MPKTDYSATLRALLLDAGLDVVHDFTLDERMLTLFPFETFGRNVARGLLIGNGRKIWPRFISWFASQADPPNHPLDHYVSQAVARALQAAGAPRSQSYFSPVMDYSLREGKRGPLPIQKIAAVSGLAALSPVHLNIHPAYGPWLSLRAVVSLDAPPRATSSTRVQPCASCEKPCLVPFEAAMERRDPEDPKRSVRQNWLAWLAVRQACPVGKEHAFGADQNEYHYLHNPAHLRRVSRSVKD